MSCVCATVDVPEVLQSLSHIVNSFSALTCGGTVSRRVCNDFDACMLDNIDQKLVGTLARARMLRNSLARINQLPPEVLGTIFGMIYDPPIPLSHSSTCNRSETRAWLVVLRVCQYWRTLALSIPDLWTRVDITSPRDDDPTGLPRRSLALSRAALLSVYIHHPRAHRHSAVYQEVLMQMPRVRELHISGVHAPEDLQDFVSIPAPKLDTLVIHVSPTLGRHVHGHGHMHGHWPAPSAAVQDELPQLFVGDAPKLTYLAVEKFRIAPQNLGAFSRLQHLWLQPYTCTLPRDLTYLINMLDANPALEDLIIEGVVLEAPPPPNPHYAAGQVAPALRRVSLPALRRLVFTASDAGSVALVLAHLALPAHTAMRLVACTSLGSGSLVLLPHDVSHLENVASVTALALQLGGDIDRHICAVSRPTIPSSLYPGDIGGQELEAVSALWISDRTYGDEWIIDRLCPSLPLAQIEELWLTGFDNRPPQRWYGTFLAMPAVTKLVITDANWNAEDWLLALSMNGEVSGEGSVGKACPGLRELHVRAPSAMLRAPLSFFVQDRARCGLPLRQLHVMLLPSQRAEVIKLFTEQANEWRMYVEEVVVEVVERFPRMLLPSVCTSASTEHGFWPNWHDTNSYQ